MTPAKLLGLAQKRLYKLLHTSRNQDVLHDGDLRNVVVPCLAVAEGEKDQSLEKFTDST